MIRDDASGFAIDIAPPNAVVCIMYPPSLSDAKACAGIDAGPTLQALSKLNTAEKAAIAVARIRHDDWTYDAMVLRQSWPRAATMTSERVDTWVKQTQQGVASLLHRDVAASGVNGEPFAPAVINDMNVLPIALTPTGDGAPSLRVLGWSFIGKDRIVTASFTTDAAHVEVVRHDAEQIVSTVSWADAKSARQKAPFARQAASGMPTWAQALIVLATLAALIFVVGRLRRAKRSPAGKRAGA